MTNDFKSIFSNYLIKTKIVQNHHMVYNYEENNGKLRAKLFNANSPLLNLMYCWKKEIYKFRSIFLWEWISGVRVKNSQKGGYGEFPFLLNKFKSSPEYFL